MDKATMERRAEMAEKLTLCFEDVHLDGVTGEIVARRHTCPGNSFFGLLKRDPLERGVLGYVAHNGHQRPRHSTLRPR